MDEIIDIKKAFLFLLRQWKITLVNIVVAVLIAIYYSFFVAEKQFVSTVTFLPPYSESSIASVFSMGGIGSILGTDIMPEQIETIFMSLAIRRQIIEKYNYYEKYQLLDSKNRFVLATEQLSKDLVLNSIESGNLGLTKYVSFNLSCYHTSPDTSFLIVKTLFHLIDSTINEISISKGRDNRRFISQQLSKNKNTLDSLTVEFNNFQKENKVYDIDDQLQISFANYTLLNNLYIKNQVRIKTFKVNYSSDYAPIKALNEENRVLLNKMNNIIEKKDKDISIGLNYSVDMLKDFVNYKRDMEIQNVLVSLLTTRLQEAKLKESKSISSLTIVDAPFIPEYKVRPKRAMLLVMIVMIVMILWHLLLIGYYFYTRIVVNNTLYRELVDALRKKD